MGTHGAIADLQCRHSCKLLISIGLPDFPHFARNACQFFQGIDKTIVYETSVLSPLLAKIIVKYPNSIEQILAVTVLAVEAGLALVVVATLVVPTAV